MCKKITFAYQSIKGHHRFDNQDNLYINGLVLPEKHKNTDLYSGNLDLNDACSFCVFDGLGGEAHGQKASYLAAESYSKYKSIPEDKEKRRLLIQTRH